MTLRVATFNVENLMARYDFTHSATDDRAQTIALDKIKRFMTAAAIADCHADIICLQEVENLETLERFERNYLQPAMGGYEHRILVEGNDGRGIDVALLARKRSQTGAAIDIVGVTSHHRRTFSDFALYSSAIEQMGFAPDAKLFRRDCLNVDVVAGGKSLSLFICHFKSMGPTRPDVDSRQYTMPVRQAEAAAVRKIIEHKFPAPAQQLWLVCGDLNDYRQRMVVSNRAGEQPEFELYVENESGVDPLLQNGFCRDLVARRKANDRWTLYFAREPQPQHLVQLDYMLASPSLARRNATVSPDILRRGLPLRTVFPSGQAVEPYEGTGWSRPKASDHCPVAVTLELG